MHFPTLGHFFEMFFFLMNQFCNGVSLWIWWKSGDRAKSLMVTTPGWMRCFRMGSPLYHLLFFAIWWHTLMVRLLCNDQMLLEPFLLFPTRFSFLWFVLCCIFECWNANGYWSGLVVERLHNSNADELCSRQRQPIHRSCTCTYKSQVEREKEIQSVSQSESS